MQQLQAFRPMDSPPSPSAAAKAVWLLISLAALQQAYEGLSSILLPFLGEPSYGIGIASWMIATGAPQLITAVFALRHAARQNLRGATLAVAVAMLLGWLTTVPSVVEHGLDFRANGWLTPGYFVVSPFVAFTALGLAWRGSYPVLAALVVIAPICVGLLLVMILAISIALYGF